jgi:hypothetical protein
MSMHRLERGAQLLEHWRSAAKRAAHTQPGSSDHRVAVADVQAARESYQAYLLEPTATAPGPK